MTMGEDLSVPPLVYNVDCGVVIGMYRIAKVKQLCSF